MPIGMQGFQKGHVAWNKGKCRSRETKEKISRANKGKCRSEETKEKIRKTLRGRALSEATKRKISKGLIGKMTRENAPNWKGGKYKNSRGYVLVLMPEHPFCNSYGYVRDHRLVMESHLGRHLDSKEVVHHENEIVDDNRIENLRLFENNVEHTKYHNSNERI